MTYVYIGGTKRINYAVALTFFIQTTYVIPISCTYLISGAKLFLELITSI